MHWRLVGPFRGGRALAASGIPGNPYVFYFGSVDGGMWKTTNAGLTWNPIGDGQMNPSVGSFAISQSDPNIIYVGTGEADMRSDITYGDGVYKTTDGGQHWIHLGLGDTRQIGRILIDPKDPDIVLVAALGHAYGPNEERGVFRTTDGGKTWKNVLYKGPNVGAIDLASDPEDPSVVYASMWMARRPPWSQYPPDQGSAVSKSDWRADGIYKSTDEGQTWAEVGSHGLPEGPLGRIGLSVVTGSHGENLYAIIDALKKGSGLYHSNDGGKSWTLAGNDPRIASRMWYFSRLVVDPQNPNIIYVPNVALMRSTDGGKTWEAIKGAPGGDDYHFLWVDPTDDKRMIVASDQGTVISVDGGKTWSSWYNQPTGQMYHVTTDNHFPFRIYGAQQDAGTVCITSRSNDGTITFRNWHPVAAGESGYIAPDPRNPNIVYGGDTYGGMYRFNRITGQSQVISPSPLAEFGTPIPQRKYRFTWTSPIVFDPHDPHTIYYGAQVLLKSRDGGLHWAAISPDLTGALPRSQRKPGQPNIGDAASQGWGVIYTIAPSPVRPGMIWVGSDDGLIHITTDGGKKWENVTPPGLRPWSKITMVEASPFNPGEAYAAVDCHRLDDVAPYIYRTTDFGKRWQLIVNGIGDKDYVNVVRCDHKRPGLLYAGTEEGVYVSFNDGNNWQSLQLNLPVCSIRDLAVRDNDLVAATHGRAFWVLDDITPLQQLNEKILGSNAFLFKPETAVRIRRSVNSDTPLPPEIPQGTNPPSGAIIDYYLHSAPSGPISLEILDGSGNVVRRYSSDDRPLPTSKVPIVSYWFPPFKKLTTHAGLNRFEWDLSYPPPPVSHYGYTMRVANLHSSLSPAGPLALPGNYTVKLKVDGHSYTKRLRVVMDPRVHVSKTALRDQLSLAIKVWNSISDENAISGRLTSMTKQVKDGDVSGSTQRLQTEMSQVRDSLAVGELAMLEGEIMSADREPTAQMRMGYKLLEARFAYADKVWSRVKSDAMSMLGRSHGSSPVNQTKKGEARPVHLVMP